MPLFLLPYLSTLGLLSTGYAINDVAGWFDDDDGTPLQQREQSQVKPVVYVVLGVAAAGAGLYINKKINGAK